MKEKEKNLGALESVHGIAPAYLQRAAIVAVISFVFFLLMLVAFAVRQNIGYFLLATAFLIVQFFTLFGWIMQKRSVFKMYENGFSYKKHVCLWNEIKLLNVRQEHRAAQGKISCEIKIESGEKIVLNETTLGIEDIIRKLRAKTAL